MLFQRRWLSRLWLTESLSRIAARSSKAVSPKRRKPDASVFVLVCLDFLLELLTCIMKVSMLHSRVTCKVAVAAVAVAAVVKGTPFSRSVWSLNQDVSLSAECVLGVP